MTRAQPGYRIELVGDDPLDPDDDNVDVLVRFDDGRAYTATFFTIANLRTLMDRYRASGECAGGLYVWSSEMIVVDRLDRATIERTVADLVAAGELEAAFAAAPGR